MPDEIPINVHFPLTCRAFSLVSFFISFRYFCFIFHRFLSVMCPFTIFESSSSIPIDLKENQNRQGAFSDGGSFR